MDASYQGNSMIFASSAKVVEGAMIELLLLLLLLLFFELFQSTVYSAFEGEYLTIDLADLALPRTDAGEAVLLLFSEEEEDAVLFLMATMLPTTIAKPPMAMHNKQRFFF